MEEEEGEDAKDVWEGFGGDLESGKRGMEFLSDNATSRTHGGSWVEMRLRFGSRVLGMGFPARSGSILLSDKWVRSGVQGGCGSRGRGSFLAGWTNE